jgi:hypothetical protein
VYTRVATSRMRVRRTPRTPTYAPTTPRGQSTNELDASTMGTPNFRRRRFFESSPRLGDSFIEDNKLHENDIAADNDDTKEPQVESNVEEEDLIVLPLVDSNSAEQILPLSFLLLGRNSNPSPAAVHIPFLKSHTNEGMKEEVVKDLGNHLVASMQHPFYRDLPSQQSHLRKQEGLYVSAGNCHLNVFVTILSPQRPHGVRSDPHSTISEQ